MFSPPVVPASVLFWNVKHDVKFCQIMPKCSKVVVLGSKKVGKSAIIEQLVHGHHSIGAVSYKDSDLFFARKLFEAKMLKCSSDLHYLALFEKTWN